MTDQERPAAQTAQEASTAPPARVPTVDVPRSVRLGGAILAAIVAGLAIALAVRMDALVANPPDSPIAVVFGADGLARRDLLTGLLVWAVGPAAAAVAGWWFAVPAVRSVDGSGLWMGAVTYVLAIAIAPVAFISGFGDAVDSLFALPFVWLFAGAALAPLLAVCLVAGPVWSLLLRRTVGNADLGPASSRSLPIWPVLLLGALVLLGWIVLTSVLGSAGGATFD